MKKLFVILLLLGLPVHAQISFYEHPEHDRIIQKHKIVGILPFDFIVKTENVNQEEEVSKKSNLLEMERTNTLQLALYSWFIDRNKNGRFGDITFQSPEKTVSLLKQKGIVHINLIEYKPDDLARILEVDALILGSCQANTSVPAATVNMSMYHGENGFLLWNYIRKVKGDIDKNTDRLVHNLMENASKYISYIKEK